MHDPLAKKGLATFGFAEANRQERFELLPQEDRAAVFSVGASPPLRSGRSGVTATPGRRLDPPVPESLHHLEVQTPDCTPVIGLRPACLLDSDPAREFAISVSSGSAAGRA
jgi:hypothetical protein